MLEETKLQETGFEDPVNVDEIMQEILTCKTYGDIVAIILKIFPDWILGEIKQYSKDYPHLKNNWDYLCKRNKSEQLSILIVSKIFFNRPNHTLLNVFCELLTLFGHSVRRVHEFTPCKICGDGIPSKDFFTEFQDRKLIKISCWMLKCHGC